MNIIKEIRKQKKMTQADLAKIVGVNTSIITRYENGTIIPPLSRMNKIAEGLDVSVDYLLMNINSSDYVQATGRVGRIDFEKSIQHNNMKLVLFYAHGVCELCQNKAPFNDLNGFPYLEVYPLVDDLSSYNHSTNTLVALCPNCHAKMRVRNDAKDIAYLTEVASKHNF